MRRKGRKFSMKDRYIGCKECFLEYLRKEVKEGE